MSVTIGLKWPGYGYEKGKRYHRERHKKGMLMASEYGKVFGAKTRKPWVRKIGTNEFLEGQFTYQRSDVKANRGVKIYFHLFEGNIYDVCYWKGYKKKVRYKCEIKNGKICRKST